MVGSNNISKISPTLCNDYPNQEKEFVFAVKGRPFGCLVSPYLPTPTSTIIDYNLVRDIGMKMTDLQYTKFCFAGQKMRILGKVSITVQTIHDGLASGNFHMKATVILDLAKNLEIECVAGVKLTKQLQDNCTYSGALSTGSSSAASTPRSSPRSSPPPSRAATPPRPRTPSPSPAPTPTPKSPPGFPVKPQYRDSVPVQSRNNRPQIHVSMTTVRNPTPLSLNLHALEEAFCNADLMPDMNKELRALHEADPHGLVNMSDDQVMTFTTTAGLLYEFGHGRNRCHPDRCLGRTPDAIPSNCGYNGQWLSPNNFRSCGHNCRGAFCRCINDY